MAASVASRSTVAAAPPRPTAVGGPLGAVAETAGPTATSERSTASVTVRTDRRTRDMGVRVLLYGSSIDWTWLNTFSGSQRALTCCNWS